MPVAAVSVGGTPMAAGQPPQIFAQPAAATEQAPAAPAQAAPPTKRKRKGGVGYAIVGVIGELMITVGVFLGLFVIWQLVWTDVQANRVAAAAADQAVEAPGWVKANPTESGVRHTDDPPVEKAPALGKPIGFLHVPRFGMDYDRLISEGVDKATVLDRLGIGHYPDTQMPGEMGNFALAAHRITYGEPFAQITTMQKGDYIIVETNEVWYVYKMVSKEIVLPSDYSVVYPNPGGEPGEEGTRRLLTLTSCHPRFTSTHRYIVHAEMEYWELKTEGTPPELNQKPVGESVEQD